MSKTNLNLQAPSVSVIVPVYGVEAYVGICAESLFKQDFPNIEFIFVDDETPDNSIEVIRQTLESFPECKDKTLIVRQKNTGLPGARMCGLRHATGDFVIHVDSDDWVEPDFVSSMVELALKEDADVVYCDYYQEYESRPTKRVFEGDFFPCDGPIAAKAMTNSIIRAYMWNKLEKRSLYDLDTLVVPIFGYHEDIVFQSQVLSAAQRVVHLDKPLYHYRRRRRGALTAGNVFKTRTASAANMLHLWSSIPEDSPVESACGVDILLRAGWYCCIIFRFKMMMQYPEVVEFLADLPYQKWNRVPLSKQCYVKFCCRIMRRFLSSTPQ